MRLSDVYAAVDSKWTSPADIAKKLGSRSIVIPSPRGSPSESLKLSTLASTSMVRAHLSALVLSGKLEKTKKDGRVLYRRRNED